MGERPFIYDCWEQARKHFEAKINKNFLAFMQKLQFSCAINFFSGEITKEIVRKDRIHLKEPEIAIYGPSQQIFFTCVKCVTKNSYYNLNESRKMFWACNFRFLTTSRFRHFFRFQNVFQAWRRKYFKRLK